MPSAGDEKEIYAELVAGLGEAIVSGMVPGTSLCFTARKDDLGNPQVPLLVKINKIYSLCRAGGACLVMHRAL
jgi:hypothetical protein